MIQAAIAIATALIERSDQIVKVVLTRQTDAEIRRDAAVMLRKIQDHGAIRRRALHRRYWRQSKKRHARALKLSLQSGQVRERADLLLEANTLAERWSAFPPLVANMKADTIQQIVLRLPPESPYYRIAFRYEPERLRNCGLAERMAKADSDPAFLWNLASSYAAAGLPLPSFICKSAALRANCFLLVPAHPDYHVATQDAFGKPVN